MRPGRTLTRPVLKQVLTGRMQPHQRFRSREQLLHTEEIEARIERLNAKLGQRLAPEQATLTRRDSIPGVVRQLVPRPQR